MESQQDIRKNILELKIRLQKEMPKVRKEIRIYEEKLGKGQLTKKPISAPQFNA